MKNCLDRKHRTAMAARRTIAVAVVSLACAEALATNGQVVPVGRVDVQLPGDGWQVYELDDAGNVIRGSGPSHKQQVETKVLVQPSAGKAGAVVLIVRANASGKGRTSGVGYPGAVCQGGDHVFAEGSSPSPLPRSFHCLHVAAAHDVTASGWAPAKVTALLQQQGWTLPTSMLGVSARQMSNSGAHASVIALLQPSVLMGMVAPAQADLLPPLPPSVSPHWLQWGRQLQEAVRRSVYSVGGDLVVPAFRSTSTGGEISSAISN